MPPNIKRVVFDEKVDKPLSGANKLDETNVPELKSSEYIENVEDLLISDAKVVPKEGAALEPREYKIRYRNLINFLYGHIAGLYGGYLAFTSAHPLTLLFGLTLLVVGLLGITAGVHRLWAHRSYKAKLPLRILLMIFNSIANQNSIFNWARDHRMHHKFSDTDADPHNAGRGFFFSHIAWLVVRKHPELLRKGHLLDNSDLYNDPVVQFQHKNVFTWIPLWCFVLPTIIPMWAWNETFSNAWHINFFRYILSLHFTFLVNSLTHYAGYSYRPYDRNIRALQSPFVSFLVLGEGFHNYHHVFPWDYKTSEYGNRILNLSTIFIDAFAKIGWAYDLRTVNDDLVKARMKRTGDGTDLWGYGDKDMTEVEKEIVLTVNPKSTKTC